MDDFSWGNTRVVTGEKGKKIVISDEGKFDPASIPRKKWEDYQAELWDAQTQHDTRSEYSGYSYATKTHAPPGSEYGMPPSRPMSEFGLHPQQKTRLRSPSPSEMMISGRNTMMGADGVELVNLELPPDDALLAEIRDILRTADLMTVTKKNIKSELERRFGLSLDAKRAYIGSGMFYFSSLFFPSSFISRAFLDPGHSSTIASLDHFYKSTVPILISYNSYRSSTLRKSIGRFCVR